MIDDATIERVADESGAEAWWVSGNENYEEFCAVLHQFARAIEQLARQDQREADARICESNAYATGPMNSEGKTRYLLPSDAYKDGTGMHRAGMTYAEAIRASGK